MPTMSVKTTMALAVVLLVCGLALMGLTMYRDSGNVGNGILATVPIFGMDASGREGVASFWEEDGNVTVSIDLVGAAEGSVYPAYIHDGTCAQEGEIKYNLNSLKSGLSDTALQVSFDELKNASQLSLSIHPNMDNTDKDDPEYSPIACGVIAGEFENYEDEFEEFDEEELEEFDEEDFE